MRALVIALALSAIATSAHAVVRYQVDNKSCDWAQSTIYRHGAAILRWTSKSGSGIVRYDRYVANGSLCPGNQVPQTTYIPTADTRNCPVTRCVDPNYNRRFFRRN